LVVSLIILSTFVGQKWKNLFASKSDEYHMIRNYLLNDSPLYGYNKPKIWIHSKFEYNARVWKSFYSRSSTDLNQPYIHLTIQSIINHCADDFHICLIDDESFSKLIPTWNVDVFNLPEPLKHKYRELGMAELVYYYGGMVLPNSTVCLHNLHELYHNAIDGNKAFVCENMNRGENLVHHKRPTFIPHTTIYGAPKNNPAIQEYIELLKSKLQKLHYHDETEFLGEISEWCIRAVQSHKMNLVSGEVVGVKTKTQKPITIENLMEDEYLALSPKCMLIVIPEDEVLARHKYAWFAVLPSHEILNSSPIIAKYLKASIVDAVDKMDVVVSPKPNSIVAI
jgi:hypothetical protein